MHFVSSWERNGIEKGRQQGKEELVETMLHQRFSTVPASITKRLDKLTPEQLNDLGKSLFNLSSLVEVREWLSLH